MEAITSAVMFVDSDTGRTYKVKLVPENQQTNDASDRFMVGPISWRPGRIPFTFSDVEGDPHTEARHVGNLDNLRREIIDGVSWIVGDLDWDDDELAVEAKRLVDEDRITGVSIAPSDGEALLICGQPTDTSEAAIRKMGEEFDFETCDDIVEAWFNLVIGAATLLMLPAFEEAEVVAASVAVSSTGLTSPASDYVITVTNPLISTTEVAVGQALTIAQALHASGDLYRPPAGWFTDPKLTGPTPLTIDEDGRVYGHLALWDSCHRGFDGVCVTPPRDATDYEEFHANGRVYLDDDSVLPCGVLTVDVSHADQRASAAAASRHYDHSGTMAASVRAGDDDYGVWVAGAIKPGLEADKIELLRRLSLSGDWRPKGSRYFLIAAQAVPVPGFPIRARVASGEQVSMTTVGPHNPYEDEVVEGLSDLALVASAIGILSDKVDELLADKRRREFEQVVASFEG